MRPNRIATRSAGSRASGRSRWILASLVAAAGLVAGLLLLLREDEAPATRAAAREDPVAEAGAEPPPERLVAPERPAPPAERAPAAAEGEPPEVEHAAPERVRPAPEEPAARARLVVRALDAADGGVVEGLLVGLHPVEETDPFDRGDAAERLVTPWTRGLSVQAIVPIEVAATGADGRATFGSPPTTVPLRVVTLGERAGVPMAERTLAEADVGSLDRARWPVRLDVPALAPGERREVDFVTAVRPRRALRVRVTSDAGPVEDAAVVLVRRRATAITGTGSVSRSDEEELGRTGADGTLEADVTLVPDVHGRVDAEDFGPAFFRLPDGAGAGGDAHEIAVRLARTAGVVGRLVDPAGGAVAGVRVQARAHTRDLPWFGGRPRDEDQGGELEWRARVDPDGRFALLDLPAGAPLQVVLMYDERTLCDVERPLVLAPEEVRGVAWTVCAGLTLTGTLLDRDGRPLGERAVWLLRAEPGSDGLRYLRGNELEADEVQDAVRTDLDGRFVARELVPGDYWLAAAPAEHDGPPVAVLVTVGPTQEDVPDVELRVRAPLYVRGSVVRRGEPCPRASVRAFPEPGYGELFALADEEGQFVLGPLAPGALRLQAEVYGAGGPEGVLLSPVVRANAGDVALELVVP